MSERLHKPRNKILELISDLIILIGCALLIYGAYLLNPIAAILTGAVLLIALGILLGALS
jgi:TRAP-type C4-dicarboxylate transport system permease small subunit